MMMLSKLFGKRKKTPTIFQMEAMECGAACLTMILAYYGKQVPLSEIRTACDVTRDGSRASNILEAAAMYDLDAEGYSCDIEVLREEVNFPCIVFWEFNHFVVLEGIARNTVYLNDPAVGPRTLSVNEFSKSFTGIILELKPTAQFKKGGTPPSNPMSLLWEWVTAEKATVVYLLILSGFLGIASTVPALIMQVFVDNVLIQQDISWSYILIARMFGSALTCGILLYLLWRYLFRYVIKMQIISVSRLVWKLLQLPFAFFQQRMLGDIAVRVHTYEQIANFVADHVTDSVIAVVLTLFYLSAMFLVDTHMALCIIGILIVNASVIWLFKNRMNNAGQTLAQKMGKLSATETSTIENMESLKANAQEDYYFQTWAGYQTSTIQAAQTSKVLTAGLELMPTCFLMINKLFILGYGSYMVLVGDLSIGAIIGLRYLSDGCYEKLPRIFLMIATLSQLRGQLTRILDIRNYPIEKPAIEAPAAQYPDAVLSIEHLRFGYSRLAPPLPMLTDFSLQIYPNQKIGLVGSSGSGKSTLLKLICAFYQPWEGCIYMEGHAIHEMKSAQRSRHMAYVGQEIYLFEGTVRDNLTLWSDSFDDDALYAVLEDLGLGAVVHERGGLNTLVEAGGSNFSGGQRQRLELARALLHRPELLILDEATSALDNITERKVYETATKYASSLLIVAHRLSAIRSCDHIIVLKDGAIIERGDHASLVLQQGFYATELLQNEL